MFAAKQSLLPYLLLVLHWYRGTLWNRYYVFGRSLFFCFQGISLDLLWEILFLNVKEKRGIFVECSGKYILTNFVKESKK